MKRTGHRGVMDILDSMIYDHGGEEIELARDEHGEAEIHDGLLESYMRVKDANGDEFYVIVKAVEVTS